MNLKIIPAYEYPKEIQELFSEYTAMLVSVDSSFQNYLDIQNYDEEIKHLNLKYVFPGGKLYLAFIVGQLPGVIGLRKL